MSERHHPDPEWNFDPLDFSLPKATENTDFLGMLIEDTNENRLNARELYLNWIRLDLVKAESGDPGINGSQYQNRDYFSANRPVQARANLRSILEARSLENLMGKLSIKEALGILADEMSKSYQKHGRFELIAWSFSRTLFLVAEYGLSKNDQSIGWEACLRARAVIELFERPPEEFQRAPISYSLWQVPKDILSMDSKQAIRDEEQNLSIRAIDSTELETERAMDENAKVILAASLTPDAAPSPQMIRILQHLYNSAGFEPRIPSF